MDTIELPNGSRGTTHKWGLAQRRNCSSPHGTKANYGCAGDRVYKV